MENFITIAVFDYSYEIELLKHRLDHEEIRYYIENDSHSSIVPMFSWSMGGIRLKVHPNDQNAVQRIIDELKGGHHLRIV